MDSPKTMSEKKSRRQVLQSAGSALFVLDISIAYESLMEEIDAFLADLRDSFWFGFGAESEETTTSTTATATATATSTSDAYDGFPSTSVPDYISNPVIQSSSYSDSRLRAPNVRPNGSGGYKMHYEATSSGGTNGIYEADSSDGNDWTENTTPLLTPASGYDWISMPTVVERDGTWYMWYGRRDSSSSNFEIALATASSIDGPWTKQGTVLSSAGTGWENDEVRGPDVIVVDGEFWMYYMGSNGDVWQIGLARSSDGSTWTRESTNPVIESVPDTFFNTDVANPGVTRVDGEFWCFFEGLKDDTQPAKIGLARSDDGVSWGDPYTDPVIEPTSTDGWRDYSVYDADPAWIGDDLLVYFTGTGDTQQIGAEMIEP